MASDLDKPVNPAPGEVDATHRPHAFSYDPSTVKQQEMQTTGLSHDGYYNEVSQLNIEPSA